MRHLRRLGADFQALELTAQRAGSAWACIFASSEEYEAALIREQRAAGCYGRTRERQRLWLILAAGAAAVVLLVLLLV